MRTTTIKSLLAMTLGAAGALTLTPVHANDANGERDTSVYDKNPDCMNRGQVAPGQPAPCELLVPPSGRRPVVRAPGAASASAGGTLAAGGQASAGSSATAASGGSSEAVRARGQR